MAEVKPLAANDGFYGNFPSIMGSVATDSRVAAQTQMSGNTMPTADPHVKGLLWNNAGVVTVSAG